MMTVIFLILLFVLIVAVVRFGDIKTAWSYFKRHKQPRQGILMFIGLFATAALVAFLIRPAEAGDWRYFQYAEAYAGVEWPTDGQSPQCVSQGADDKTTSNGGARLNLVEYKRFLSINAKYTHHSCAFNEDRNVYDAFGAELSFPLFDRRK